MTFMVGRKATVILPSTSEDALQKATTINTLDKTFDGVLQQYLDKVENKLLK